MPKLVISICEDDGPNAYVADFGLVSLRDFYHNGSDFYKEEAERLNSDADLRPGFIRIQIEQKDMSRIVQFSCETGKKSTEEKEWFKKYLNCKYGIRIPDGEFC